VAGCPACRFHRRHDGLNGRRWCAEVWPQTATTLLSWSVDVPMVALDRRAALIAEGHVGVLYELSPVLCPQFSLSGADGASHTAGCAC
jgi:hypothetical protein